MSRGSGLMPMETMERRRKTYLDRIARLEGEAAETKDSQKLEAIEKAIAIDRRLVFRLEQDAGLHQS